MPCIRWHLLYEAFPGPLNVDGGRDSLLRDPVPLLAKPVVAMALLRHIDCVALHPIRVSACLCEAHDPQHTALHRTT